MDDATDLEVPAALQGLLRLRSGVALVPRQNGRSLLVSSDGRRAVMVGASADALLPSLQRGARAQDLLERLRTIHRDEAPMRQALWSFLLTLHSTGLLESGPVDHRGPARRARRMCQLDIDPMAAVLANRLRAVPATWRRALAILAVVAAVTGLSAILPDTLDRWLATAPLRQLDPLALGLFVSLFVPLHELGHAVACRLAGVPVVRAGVMLVAGIVPVPFVDTTSSYRVASRRARVWIPAAGLLVDLLAAGTSAWVIALSPSTSSIAHTARFFLMLSLMALYVDSNPLAPSDGSRVLGVVLDAERARVAATSRWRPPSIGNRVVVLYRLACLPHLLSALWLGWSILSSSIAGAS